MTKIDIFSGFLGAGKTTLIKKLIKEAYNGEKLVLIENEFGEIGIDGGFLKEAGIEITEMNSGCICCSLVGHFGKALEEVLDRFAPDRILIEPSGVGKLSDVIRAVQNIGSQKLTLNGFTTIVDANKCKMYLKNFGEFFGDQIEHASSIILSHTDNISEEKLEKTVALIREHNADATIVTTPWNDINGKAILDAIEKKNTLLIELEKLEHKHHHHDCDCEHEHHHNEDDKCSCGHHHHEHEHHHEHHHDGECECGCGHDHHHHHADEVFTSMGRETTKKFSKEEIENALKNLDDDKLYGMILRAKGIVKGNDGNWIHFDYIPGEPDVRNGGADIIGRLCVIGKDINEQAIAELFGI
jgi:G3E family GTPase